jgi:hypothetical protein
LKCDLEKLFKEVDNKLFIATNEGENFIFSSETLPIPLSKLETEQLVIKKGQHFYSRVSSSDLEFTARYDVIRWQAHKETYKNLGLLILAVLFHPDIDQVNIELTHPLSEIKHLVVAYSHPKLQHIDGYVSRPFALGYEPKQTEGYLNTVSNFQPSDLPCFYFANWNSPIYNDAEWKSCDTVIGFGNDVGSSWFAELLLNASLPSNKIVEYRLEGEMGYRGVGPGSAEVKLYLPGSLGWDNIL